MLRDLLGLHGVQIQRNPIPSPALNLEPSVAEGGKSRKVGSDQGAV